MSENTSPTANTSGDAPSLVPGEYRVPKSSDAVLDTEDKKDTEKQAAASDVSADDEAMSDLFPPATQKTFGERWSRVQAGFVDEPRNAVVEADRLVDETLGQIQDIFAQRRAKLEEQWNAGAEASTEDLRLTLQNYRSFFERLLKI